MSLKRKLYLLIYVLVALLLLVGANALWQIHSTHQHFRTTYDDRIVPMWQLKTVADAYAVGIVDAAHKANQGALSYNMALLHVRNSRALIQHTWHAYLETYLTPDETALVKQAQELLVRADGKLDHLERLLQQGDSNGLASFIRGDLYTTIDPISAVMVALNNLQLKVAGQHYQAANADYRFALISTALISIACLVIAMLMSHKLLFLLYGKIQHLRNVMAQVWQSRDLRLRANNDQIDEIDLIAGDYNRLLDQQQYTMRTMAEATLLFEQVLDILTNTTDEITQVAGHSSESAGSIAAAVEEMASSGELINQNARDARQLIERNSESALRGSMQIHSTLDRVRHIDEALTNAHARLEAFISSVHALGQGEIDDTIHLVDNGQKLLRVITDTVHRAHESTALAELAEHAIESIITKLAQEKQVATELAEALNEQHAGARAVALEVERLSQITEAHAATLIALKHMTETMQEVSGKLKSQVSAFSY